MEEKVIIRGVFSKFNGLSFLFAYLTVGSITGGIVIAATETPFGIIMTLIGVPVFSTLAYYFYCLWNKCEITVTEKRVYGKVKFGRYVDLPLDSIYSVSMCGRKDIAISTSSGMIKFSQFKNRYAVYTEISKLLKDRKSITDDINPALQTNSCNNKLSFLKNYWFFIVFPLCYGVLGFVNAANKNGGRRIIMAIIYALGALGISAIMRIRRNWYMKRFKKKTINTIFTLTEIIVCIFVLGLVLAPYLKLPSSNKTVSEKKRDSENFRYYAYEAADEYRKSHPSAK